MYRVNMTSTTARPPTATIAGSFEGVESKSSKVTKSLGLGVLFVVSVIGNALIIACVVKNVNKRMRTVSNLLIVNTSIAYLLITIVNIPDLIYNINTPPTTSIFEGNLGPHLCRLKSFAPFLSVTLSTQSFAILAIDRFIAVFYPLRRITHKVAYVLIALTWINSFIFGGVYLYGSVTIRHPSTGMITCVMHVQKTFKGLPGLVIFVWTEFTVFYAFPLLIAGVLCVATIVRLWKSQISRGNNERGPMRMHTRYSDTTNKNAIKMLTTVLVLFALAWLPLWIYTVICRGNSKAFFKHPICRSRTFVFLIYFIGYSHGAVAPFIYPIFSQNFKAGFKNICCCAWLRWFWNANIVPINSIRNSLELKPFSSQRDNLAVTAVSINYTGD